MEQAYELLSPTIQEYIYKKGWMDLREIQEKAIPAILTESHNVLLTSGTASGKTEAAFFPVLSDLEMHPSSTIAVLYISPLIALINDQFERLQDILEEEELPIVRWHGQALASAKKRIIAHPQGIIQITPESLEALLIRESRHCRRLFGDLRYIIIDEVHAFMGSERGLQVQSLIGRIAQMIGHPVRHIGLSATLADYDEASKWLEAGNGLDCIVCSSGAAGGKLNLLVKECPYIRKEENDIVDTTQPWMEVLYHLVKGHRSIVFANTRNEVEFAVAGLHDMSAARGNCLEVFAHHGSLSRLQRGEAEDALKNHPGSVCVGATVTLELGIDVGSLDMIVQTGAPLSVSSFVQRLGRTGRKGQNRNMAFVLKRRDAVWKADPTYLPFDLLSTIATIELYLKEHWIEPVHPLEKCYFLALHQTLSVLRSLGALSVQSLARHILTLSPFRAITIDAYRTLLHGMLDEKLLETMEDGTINLGERGEELVSFYDFYSVFLVMPEMTIKFQDKVLGTVGRDLRKGDRIVLSGYKWKITEIDYDRMIAFVVSDGKGGYAKWEGNGSLQVDDRILVKIKEILDSDESYPYLDPCAVDYLGKARERYRSLGIGNDVVVRIERDMVRIYPWLGSRSLACLSACFKSRGIDAIMEDDFCLAVEGRGALTEQAVRTALEAIRYAPVDLMELDVDEQAMRGNFKYDTLLPMELRKEAYVTWAYDPAGMKKGLGRLMEKQRCQSNMMTKSTEQGRLGKKTSGQRNRNQSDD